MPKKRSTKAAKPGSIYRITLENFVTYKEVELFPGPSLNLIIGPNGTGKSTFVCAIILGLCGKTSVIGRAKKISEYVRSGCEQATIEIELHGDPNNVTITRTFNLQDNSTWKIDGRIVREKRVQDLIATMNIQVDNLCQLLPQDRVQDFSKMDSQQLLRSTLAAVGWQQSVQQLDELINTRREQCFARRLQNNAQLLKEKVWQNERCVDEINQGMDPVNERKMLHMLFKVTTQCDHAQYFLLTPKLLTNLEYNSKIMVHTIMNGKQIMNNKEWSHQDFLQKAKAYRPLC